MADAQPRRWFVEAVVIVGSILLAFALDAWWNERVRVSELEADLLDVRREVVAAIEEMEPAWRFHLVRERLAERVGARLGSVPVGGTVEVRAGDLGLLLPQQTSDFRTLTVESFMARGGLEILPPNAALAVQRWPGVAADLVDDEVELRQTMNSEMTPELRRRADLRLAVVSDMQAAVQNTGGPDSAVGVEVTRELRNLFAWRAAAEYGVGNTMQVVCELAVEIVDAIDSRIPNDRAPLAADRCEPPELPAWLLQEVAG